MKKMFALAVAAFALAANAEWKTIGTIQCADNVTLAQGVAKLGEFTGNAMIGMMAAGALNDLPGMAAFGPGRKGVPTTYVYLVENGDYQYAILYPIAITKEEFLKKYPGAVESNGLIKAECPVTRGDTGVNYIAFSKDGKWVGFSDVPQQARVALESIKTAEKPMDGDMVKVCILKRGLDEFAKGGEEPVNPVLKDILSQLGGVALGVRVSDKGLDFRGAVKTVKDTELAKVGKIPLGENPLAFAGKDSLAVSAVAENCGKKDIAAEWNEIKAKLEKAGVNFDWLEFVQKNTSCKFTLDLGKLIVYLKTLEEQKDDKRNEAIGEAVKELFAAKTNELFQAKGPAVSSELAFKGYAGKFLPAQRFTYTLPEVAEKKPFAVGFASLYSSIRTVLPEIAKAEPENAQEIQTVMALLPPEGQGGIAYMAWNENDSLRFFFRIGADEFKAVSAGFAAFASMAQSKRKHSCGAKTVADEVEGHSKCPYPR